MASYTKEELAQMIAQIQDSGQNAGACIMAEMKKDRTPSDKNKYYWMWREEKKKRQEVEGELSILKGIGNTSPEMKTLQKRVKELENSLSIALEINDTDQRNRKKMYEELDLKQKELDRVGKENNDLFIRIAELTK